MPTGDKARDEDEREFARLADGWRLSIQIHERLRRGEEGRPLLELMKNEPGPV